jgi:hypothetical protein
MSIAHIVAEEPYAGNFPGSKCRRPEGSCPRAVSDASDDALITVSGWARLVVRQPVEFPSQAPSSNLPQAAASEPARWSYPVSWSSYQREVVLFRAHSASNPQTGHSPRTVLHIERAWISPFSLSEWTVGEGLGAVVETPARY